MNKTVPEFISIDLKKSLKYLLCGQLNASDFVHMKRNIDMYVLIIVKRGILNITIEDRQFKVGQNEMILLPAFMWHQGYRDADTGGKVVYFWVHFFLNNDFLYDKPCGSDTRLNIFMKLTNAARANILCTQLMDVSRTTPVDNAYCSFLLDALVCELSFQAKNTLVSVNKTVNNAADWIRLHITEPISLDDTADALGYNKRYLSRVFMENMGVSVNKYIESGKMELAKNILVYSDESIHSIAAAIGYEDAGSFMRVFKKNENMTCREYRSAYSKINMNKI